MAPMRAPQTFDGWNKWLRMFLTISSIILMWSISLFLVSIADPYPKFDFEGLATLLFGASSIAVFMLSTLIAIIALVNWQDIKKRLDRIEDIEQSANVQSEELQAEMSGRLITLLGVSLGETSLNRTTFQVTDVDRMKGAVHYCEQGYSLLKKIGGPAEFMALNNLIFFSCFLENEQDSSFLLHRSRQLKEAAQEHGSIDLMLTSCRAILIFSSDGMEKSEAYTALGAVMRNPRITERQKQEANFCLTSLTPT